MRDAAKSREQLICEVEALRRRVAQLENPVAEGKRVDEFGRCTGELK